MIRRPPRSTLDRSSAASDVYKRQVLPQASVTVHVLVTETLQPAPGTSAPSVNVAVSPEEQLSATVAAPNAAVMSAAVGLHVSAVTGASVMTGATISLVKVTVCVAVPVLPQASVTVHVLVTETLQPAPGTSAPSVNVAVSPEEQLSATVAAPNAAVMSAAVGLQRTAVAAASVITGLTLS